MAMQSSATRIEGELAELEALLAEAREWVASEPQSFAAEMTVSSLEARKAQLEAEMPGQVSRADLAAHIAALEEQLAALRKAAGL